MNYNTLFAKAKDKSVAVGLMGAGEFGASFLFQAQKTPGLEVRAVCNRTVSKAVDALKTIGIAEENIVLCQSIEEMQSAYAAGKYVTMADGTWLAKLPIDVLVESSGNPEASAKAAYAAIEASKHVVMVSKETEVAVGPLLNSLALEKNVIFTTGEGDQPSLLVGLITWAQSLGLDIVSAGKSSEYDFVYDPEKQTFTSNGKEIDAKGMQDWWLSEGKSVEEVANKRQEITSAFAHRSIPDLCEMCLVSNATGMKIDSPTFRAPVTRIVETPEFMRPKSEGGLLNKPQTLDIINCLRRPDEVSMAGGVYIIIACHDKKSWDVLGAKGHPRTKDGNHAMIYHPAHLLGVEAGISVLAAALLNQATSGETLKPISDLVGRAARDLPEGFVFNMGGHHHVIDGVDGEVVDATTLAPTHPIPFYLLCGQKLARPVTAGAFITLADLVEPEDSFLWDLRKRQDTLFA